MNSMLSLRAAHDYARFSKLCKQSLFSAPVLSDRRRLSIGAAGFLLVTHAFWKFTLHPSCNCNEIPQQLAESGFTAWRFTSASSR